MASAIKRIRRMTLEDWNVVLQILSAVVLGATFLIGSGALWTSYLVGLRQEARLAEMNQRAEEAKLETARLKQVVAPRKVGILALTQELLPFRARRPVVEIVYVPEDLEAYQTGIQLMHALSEAGWRGQRPFPIPSEMVAEIVRARGEESVRSLPSILRVTGSTFIDGGIVVTAKSADEDIASALIRGLKASGLKIGGMRDEDVPAGTVRIVVGANQ